ncbi:MAG: transcriptional repressor LexA [Gammaproteobacteria bacterium]|nr:transcriptional repressor LexA [Gammaproteobacteria bacterium]
MEKLTERQKEILDFIRETVAASGMPPTVAEITAAMGVSSTNGIRGHLQALERKGAIELIPNASRGIRLLDLESEEPMGLPIVGQVAAGSPILAQEHIEDYCHVDADTFKPNADYLLRVKGESMRDVGIYDGDLLAVHRASRANNGQIVVARIEDEVTVKRLKIKGHIAYLQPENPDFDVIKVNMKKQPLDIEGIAVGVLRQL